VPIRHVLAPRRRWRYRFLAAVAAFLTAYLTATAALWLLTVLGLATLTVAFGAVLAAAGVAALCEAHRHRRHSRATTDTGAAPVRGAEGPR